MGTVVAVIAAFAVTLATAGAAFAVNVTTTADHNDKFCNAADCTLREAVELTTGPITLPAGTYNLSAALGELVMANDQITGAGARTTIINGGNGTRVFRVPSGNSSISGVTITGGNGASSVSAGQGGGIFIAAEAQLQMTNSAVAGNTGTVGGGIAVLGRLVMVGATVSGNRAQSTAAAAGVTPLGGGIVLGVNGIAALGNATISGNQAIAPTGGTAQGGGIYAQGGAMTLANVTVANNTAPSGGGLYMIARSGSPSIVNSVFGGNTGGACAGLTLSLIASNHDVANDTTCGFDGTGDRQGVDPRLGPLANNTGATNTHALLAGSPAINNAGSCVATDQRGIARPSPAGGACDSGAYEYRAPTLRVVTTVVNRWNGPLTAGAVRVHVRENGTDIKGSPFAGVAAGRTHALNADSEYVVEAEAVSDYVISYSGDCALTLREGDVKTCTVTLRDTPPTLTVTTVVINHGGSHVPGDFVVRIRQGTKDVASHAGDANGTTFDLPANPYSVSADGVLGYTAKASGDCAANGAVTLAYRQDKACTVTVEEGASILRVAVTVQNDDGGTLTAAGLAAHVRHSGIDVTGSPQAGSATGTPYSLDSGDYVVSADPVAGYTLTVGGACSATGAITLASGADQTCTITARDFAPTLTVVTKVVNDSGGTRTPPSFSIHVRKGGADVSGSPKPGSASGTTYTLPAGSYAVAADALSGYSVSGCAVALKVGDAKTCTVVANDAARVVASSLQLPPPVPGKNVNALPKAGTVVKVKLPGSKTFVRMTQDTQIPLGTVIDVTKGTIAIVPSATEKALFYGGIFKLGQTKGKKPITVLSLVQKLTGCKTAKSGKANAAAKKKKVKKRRLWGDGKGKFRTKGRNSAATVLGTKWLVEDRCTSTLTRVARGKVSVRDFGKRKTVLVKAGKKYVARAR